MDIQTCSLNLIKPALFNAADAHYSKLTHTHDLRHLRKVLREQMRKPKAKSWSYRRTHGRTDGRTENDADYVAKSAGSTSPPTAPVYAGQHTHRLHSAAADAVRPRCARVHAAAVPKCAVEHAHRADAIRTTAGLSAAAGQLQVSATGGGASGRAVCNAADHVQQVCVFLISVRVSTLWAAAIERVPPEIMLFKLAGILPMTMHSTQQSFKCLCQIQSFDVWLLVIIFDGVFMLCSDWNFDSPILCVFMFAWYGVFLKRAIWLFINLIRFCKPIKFKHSTKINTLTHKGLSHAIYASLTLYSYLFCFRVRAMNINKCVHLPLSTACKFYSIIRL